ncbi:MAG TPA: glycosyltransferase family 2 protein [Acidobacteriota bacterium]|nr:glycosyltransferase family 2 protein [Acidobacteriota bacterium]
MFPKVAIIILNWNNASDTLSCLASLYWQDYPNSEIVVVDNGSSDGSVGELRSAPYKFELLELESNLGYSEGNNAGIRYALDKGAEYVLILNNDTLVAPSMLYELVQFAESRPQAGIVGPIMYYLDSRETIFAAGSFIDWAKGLTWHRGMGVPAEAYSVLEQPEAVDFIPGCGLLVRRDLVQRAGFLDADYYLNYEDVEWAVRTRQFGFEVWLVPQATLWHGVSATLGLTSPANAYYLTRNALRFFWKNAPPHIRWLSVSRILFRTLRTVLAWTVWQRYRGISFQQRRKAKLLALRDFFLGRSGQMEPDVAARVCPDQ